MQFGEDYFNKCSPTHTKRAFKRYFNLLMKETALENPRNKKLLDVGCGYGYFLKMASSFGFKTYGIDISQYAIRRARKMVKADFLLGDVQNDLLFMDGVFDVVTMFDVIEHLQKPYAALREIHRVLKPRGVFIITTPNLDSLSRRIMGGKWIGFCDETHLIFFTVRELKYILNKAGFEVRKAETIFTPLPQILSTILRGFNLGGKIWAASTQRN